MVQDAGTPSDKKNKSHILQKRITTLEHELELRFVYRSSRKVDNFSFMFQLLLLIQITLSFLLRNSFPPRQLSHQTLWGLFQGVLLSFFLVVKIPMFLKITTPLPPLPTIHVIFDHYLQQC